MKYRLILFLILSCVFLSEAKVTLPVLVSDGMVLQRDRDITIWGTADAGEAVKIRFLEKNYTTVADTGGNWSVILPPAKAGGPYVMTVNELEITDILIGDVWLCSGQSNMELPVGRVMDLYRKEVESYVNPMIRHIKVPLAYNFHYPQQDINPASWQELTPENVLSFSAVAYFFAKELFEKTKTPVGLINASVGGSPAEAWISEEGLTDFPHYLNYRDICRSDEYVSDVKKLDRERRNLWNAILYRQDAGLNGEQEWFSPGYDDSGWEDVDLFDKTWGSDGLNSVNGSHWLRKEFSVPAHSQGKPVVLRLGCIVDADSVFVNGVFVGTTAYQYPPRIYTIPANLLKEGKNTITVRLVSYSGYPGFVEDKPYKLVFDNEEISLEGTWKYRQGTRMPALPGETFFHYKPTGLYNAMIAPLQHWGIKGVLWYQGESNTGRYNEYYGLMKALIGDWRSLWKQPELPFLIVQLAGFMQDPPHPAESHWAELRNVQLRLSQTVPNTGLAVTIDIGEWNDVHPLNKKEVAHRLFLGARKIVYREKIVSSGPVYKEMRIEGDKIILTFTETGSGLIGKDGPLKHFAIAGSDRKFVWAEATIKGNEVIVSNRKVPHPVAVRYAWSNNPEEANLRNKEGLLASPFRTDDW